MSGKCKVESGKLNRELSTINYQLSTSINPQFESGQALIALIALMFIAITVITAGVALSITQTQSSYSQKEATKLYGLAEAGAETALLYLERHPNYTGTLSSGIANVTIEVSGTDPKTIVSTAEVGNTVKKIQVVVSVTNNIVSVSSWGEIE